MRERLIYITLCPKLTPYTDYVTPVNPETFAPTIHLFLKKLVSLLQNTCHILCCNRLVCITLFYFKCSFLPVAGSNTGSAFFSSRGFTRFPPQKLRWSVTTRVPVAAVDMVSRMDWAIFIPKKTT